ncbi:MAG TPA: DMT family transporter [Anaerolineae bacterium]|nr:DMT family transporter [Anaerolineae bacterium]
MSQNSVAEQGPNVPPMLVLSAGVIAIAFSAILIRFAQGEQAPSAVIAAGRLVTASLILLPMSLLWRRDELRRLEGADWRLAMVAGFFLSVHFVSWIASLGYTSVASSTVLVTTTPLWVGLASPFFLGEKVSKPLMLGILAAMVGSVIISLEALGEGSMGSNPLLGNGLALLGAVSAAIYFMIGRRIRPRLSLLSYTTVVYGASALFLLLYLLMQGHSLFGYSVNTYIFIVLMALFPQLLGHSSFNWALGFLPAAYVIVPIVSEPIGSSFLAWIFFQEVPTWPIIVGGVFILGGILLSGRGQ